MAKVNKWTAQHIKLHCENLMQVAAEGRPLPAIGQWSQLEWESGIVTRVRHTGENQWEVLAAWAVLDSYDSDYESQICEISRFSGRPHASVTVKTESLEALVAKIASLLA